MNTYPGMWTHYVDYGDGNSSQHNNSNHTNPDIYLYYAHGAAGLYQVRDDIVCYCADGTQFFYDVMGAAQNVQVVNPCPGSITINAPPHNPTPADAQWTTNFTFLTGDQITATASTSGSWTITPQGPANAAAQPPSGSGSSLAFALSFPHPAYGSGGSLAASTALSAQIYVGVCSVSDTHTIKQDTRDVIRQEYRNHSIAIPTRGQFNTPVATANFTVAEINNTAYPIIVGTPGNIAQSTRNQWNSLIGQQIGSGQTNYGLTISSAWRNPERNEAVGGVVNSNHQTGNAVDLVIPNISSVATATGLTQTQLWCLLESAGDAVGTGIPESGATQVACTSPTITHVHVQT